MNIQYFKNKKNVIVRFFYFGSFEIKMIEIKQKSALFDTKKC